MALWDRGGQRRAARWLAANTNEAVADCIRLDAVDWARVTGAYALDSADRNSPDRAALADEKTLRRWVALWRKSR